MSFGSKHVKGQRLYAPKYGKVLTEQSHKNECDINLIIKRYHKSGQLPVGQKQPLYADVHNDPGFQGAMDIVARGKTEFAKLPFPIQVKYKHDHKLWLQAVDRKLYKLHQDKIAKEKYDAAVKQIDELKAQAVEKTKGP